MGKVLFIRGGAVGDFILTMPAMRLVRESLPETEIEVLGYPGIANLALVTGIADRLRSIEDARLATFFIPGAKLDPECCAYFAGFDVVVSFLYDPDGYFAANLKVAGVKTLIACPYRPVQEAPFVPAAIQFAKPLEQLALFLDDPALNSTTRSPETPLRTNRVRSSRFTPEAAVLQRTGVSKPGPKCSADCTSAIRTPAFSSPVAKRKAG